MIILFILLFFFQTEGTCRYAYYGLIGNEAVVMKHLRNVYNDDEEVFFCFVLFCFVLFCYT